MSNRFFEARLPASVVLLMLAFGCGRGSSGTMVSSPRESCNTDTDCPYGLRCLSSVCVVSGTSESPGVMQNPGESPLIWIPLPGGTFEMGCSPGDAACCDDELPRHRVTVSSFDMLETEVTENQYRVVLGENPSCRFGRTSGPDRPVECVTFEKATAFCTAVGARLPTEAEWEYAARGGTTTKYTCGDDDSCLADIAWYGVNSGKRKHDVKRKLPNAFGLYDMLGNVYEWTSDWYGEKYYENSPDKDPHGPDSGLYRVRRGGDFYHFEGNDLSVSSRTYRGPWDGPGNLGFRCVRAASDPR